MDKLYISNSALTSAALAINAAGSATIKTVNAVNYKIDGVIYATVSGATLPALTGITVADKFTTPITVSVNAAGSFSLTAGTSVATATITASNTTAICQRTQLAEVPQAQALIGYVIIKNASGSTFTGGTTALDASNITATYINVPMAVTF